MSDVLGRIDNALDDLCPCGAAPRPDSAYCSYDCEPNHRSIHSQAETDGTQMRWRPDLVTAQDDTGLTPFDHPALYGGPHNAQILEHPDGRLHLRLDDGHRYIGCDIPAETYWAARETRALDDRWDALERELGNTRHLEPEQPRTWAGHVQEFYPRIPIGHALNAANPGETVSVHLWGQPGPVRTYRVPDDGVNVHLGASDHNPEPPERLPRSWDLIQPAALWASPNSDPLADIIAFYEAVYLGPGIYQIGVQEARHRLSEHHDYRTWHQAREDERQQTGIPSAFIPGHVWTVPSTRDPEPEHPMLAAIEARRHRNTGPAQQPRAPRNLGPRRIR